MDLIDKLRDLSARIPKLKQGELIKTEEGTKNALIMPFIQALGYDVFDPTEVTPELVADVGTKKGEKVDYAILKDGQAIMLFECKSFGTDLRQVHKSQLYRYFSVTSARFAILTDGAIYQFYTDMVEPNKMDAEPFFIFNLEDFREQTVEDLKAFSKSRFDIDVIITAASELKYQNAAKKFFANQMAEPSEEFVRLVMQEAYNGRFTQNALVELTPIVKESFRVFVNEQVDKRLKSALANTESEQQKDIEAEVPQDEAIDTGKATIITTQEETDAFLVVKSIVREVIDVSRVTMRDTQSYCGVLVDDNNRKPICRLRFNTAQKYISLIDEAKNEQKVPLTTIDDIYQYSDQLKATASRYSSE